MRIQIPDDWLLPGEFRMRRNVLCGFEIHSARMPHGGAERHARRHPGVGYFRLHCARRAIGRLPGLAPARREFDVPAKRSLARLLAAVKGVEMVGEKSLAGRDVYFALVLRHELVPAGVPRVGTVAFVR